MNPTPTEILSHKYGPTIGWEAAKAQVQDRGLRWEDFESDNGIHFQYTVEDVVEWMSL